MGNTLWEVIMDTVLTRAAQRLETAHEILSELQLLDRWREFGEPVLVGAVAYNLVVALDIDMEIYCDNLRIEDGFEWSFRHPLLVNTA